METFASWCSLAQELGQGKSTFPSELKNAERTIQELSLSIRSTRGEILVLMQSDSANSQDIANQEQRLHGFGRALFNKRAAVVRAAVAHCLEGVKELLSLIHI